MPAGEGYGPASAGGLVSRLSGVTWGRLPRGGPSPSSDPLGVPPTGGQGRGGRCVSGPMDARPQCRPRQPRSPSAGTSEREASCPGRVTAGPKRMFRERFRHVSPQSCPVRLGQDTLGALLGAEAPVAPQGQTRQSRVPRGEPALLPGRRRGCVTGGSVDISTCSRTLTDGCEGRTAPGL